MYTHWVFWVFWVVVTGTGVSTSGAAVGRHKLFRSIYDPPVKTDYV